MLRIKENKGADYPISMRGVGGLYPESLIFSSSCRQFTLRRIRRPATSIILYFSSLDVRTKNGVGVNHDTYFTVASKERRIIKPTE